MEQEHQTIDHNPTEGEMTAMDRAVSSSGDSSSGGEPNFQQLMAVSPTLAPLGGWLACLRKPAISVEYNLTKRHIPDLDTDGGGSATSPASGQTADQKAGQEAGQEAGQGAGKNSDVMRLGGHFTIRYFDFALGILGLALAGCLTRGCGCLKRLMS